ncbi:hypothetical protein NXV12_21480 [Bacteroides thetaiotaomicron]|nr:hypothetical protein [Bacteroides thetaiotaomicron]
MNPTYEHHRPYDGCDLYQGDALDVLPLLAEEGITADMVLSDPPYGTTHCRWDAVIDIPGCGMPYRAYPGPTLPYCCSASILLRACWAVPISAGCGMPGYGRRRRRQAS